MTILPHKPQGRVPVNAYVVGMIIKHDDVTKWKHFPRYWPFVGGGGGGGNSPVNSSHKGHWREALIFS